MDEPLQSSMLDGADYLARLEAVEARISEQARRAPDGLTEPEPGGDERWAPAQVWAHMAEFVPYWHGQIESVVAEYDGEPVPFGRVKTDPARIAGIDVGRHEPTAELARRVEAGIDEARRYLGRLTIAEWAAVGKHQTRGEMDVEAIVKEFIVGHLEEHLGQLEALAQVQPPDAGES